LIDEAKPGPKREEVQLSNKPPNVENGPEMGEIEPLQSDTPPTAPTPYLLRKFHLCIGWSYIPEVVLVEVVW